MKTLLNDGYVRLIDSMGNDLSIVRSARVSFNSDWRAGVSTGSDTRLINYLWEHKHVSPFESVVFTFEIKAPIFILRQWMRHNWSYNEVSLRYTEAEDSFFVPALIGKQSSDNKQSRELFAENENTKTIIEMISQHNAAAHAIYSLLLSFNCPRELARGVLPLNTYSRIFATVNLRDLLFFLEARTHAHAQHEIQVYAAAIIDLIEPIVPVAVAAWKSSCLRPKQSP